MVQYFWPFQAPPRSTIMRSHVVEPSGTGPGVQLCAVCGAVAREPGPTVLTEGYASTLAFVQWGGHRATGLASQSQLLHQCATRIYIFPLSWL